MREILNRETLPHDLLASVVVFLVALPLCMGIAIASGAPPAAGLITGIIGGVVVGFFSGCPLLVSGPAAGLAVIVYDLIQRYGLENLGLMIAAAGVIQLIAGMLRVGQMFRAIAPAVVYGMLAGIGVLIFAAQFHVMVDDMPGESGIENLLTIPQAIYKGVLPLDNSVHHLAARVGLTTVVTLVLWNIFAPRPMKWLPAALVGVVTGTAAAHFWGMPISYVDIPDDLLGSLQLPSLATVTELGAWDVVLVVATLAFVASAETLVSATAVDQMHEGPRTRYDRELLAQGIGNILAGFAGGLPMTGVIVRSATNVAAGGKTRASAILHGVWLLGLVAVAPAVLRLIPTAALAAVLVYTGYKLINIENIKRLLRYGGMPVAIYAVTLIVIVVQDLLMGILAGILLSLFSVVRAVTHMRVKVTRNDPHKRIDIHLHGAATFISMPRLVDVLDEMPRDTAVYVHIAELRYIDHSCLEAIASWEKQRHKQGDATTEVAWNELMQRYLHPAPDDGVEKTNR